MVAVRRVSLYRSGTLSRGTTMPTLLTPRAVATALSELNAATREPWTIVNGKLSKTFLFPDFVTAFAFMTHVAMVAERSNHHPEWANVYSTVKIELITHDAGGLTAQDFDLARAADNAVA